MHEEPKYMYIFKYNIHVCLHIHELSLHDVHASTITHRIKFKRDINTKKPKTICLALPLY